MDPQVISQLVRRRRDPLSALSAREREVLALVAKLRLPQTDDTNRRVLAVLAFLRSDN